MTMERSFRCCFRNLQRISTTGPARNRAIRNFTTNTTPATTSTAQARPTQPTNTSPYRCFHTYKPLSNASRPPRNHGRGPQDEDDTRADLASLDVLRNTAAPATAIDACTSQGFAFDNYMKISGCGVLLVGGEVFRWRPWLREDSTTKEDRLTGRLLNKKGQWEVPDSAWGVLDLMYPKPDLLIIGTGPHTIPIAPSVRQYLNSLGLRLDVQDTGNAAAQFNLLATERGVGQVAAALIPIGWREER